MVDIKIENVIVTVDFKKDLDLQEIASSVSTAEYNPDVFPGLIYKLKSPKTVTLMFSKGHNVCTGATSLQDARAALTIIFKKLKDLDLIDLEKMPKASIQDIIVSYKFGSLLNIQEIANKLPADDVQYDPKIFPGLIFKDKTTEITVLIFKSGTVVGFGSPALVDLEELLTELEEYY